MENTTVKKSGSEIIEGGLLIQNISIRPVQRTQMDIQKWRTAHQHAESINGSRIALYDLYSDALLDGFLKRLVAKRILGVIKNQLRYVDKSGKQIDVPVIKLRQFRQLRKAIQLHKAWGIAVIELINDNGRFKIFDVPKKHIVPSEGKIIYEQYGSDGIFYRKPPYNKTVIELGDFDDLGYLLEAVCYALYKRGNIADWANYAQIFGMPFREARYDGFNETVRLQLENALEKAGSAAFAVLPRDAELKFHESKQNAGANELYDKLRRAMNEEMLVTVLGATETTASSVNSGKAQGETHMRTVEDLTQDDKEDELSILNDQVTPVLVQLGFLPPGGEFIYNEPVNLEVAAKKIETAQELFEMGVPVGDDYIYKITGIPKPDNYDQLKKEQKIELRAKKQHKLSIEKPSVSVPAKKKSKVTEGVEQYTNHKKLSFKDNIKSFLTTKKIEFKNSITNFFKRK